MVLQKRLDYGFNGYQVPPTPRATRSARKRRSFQKGNEENQMCAFDLLAIVAGKLLFEKESTPNSSKTSTNKDQFAAGSSNVKIECQVEEKLSKVEASAQESTAGRLFVPDLVTQVHEQNSSSRGPLCNQRDLNLGLASLSKTCDSMDSPGLEKLDDKSKSDRGTFSGKIRKSSSTFSGFGDHKPDEQASKLVKDELNKSGKAVNNTASDICSAEDTVICDEKPALVNSHCIAKLPLCGNNIPNVSYPENRDPFNVVSRDDDENSSGCTHPNSTRKLFRPAPRIGDRRIRKIWASKYWKVPPKLKDVTLSNVDDNVKPVSCKRKNYYKYQRSERLYPFKKRRHFGYSLPSNSDGGISGQNPSFQPRDSPVKLRIKSFRVPELFIELPESATIGSLKRAVMEAVTAILGGGLRVGVLLQGKKVRDDDKTLLQTGISQNGQSDALGFSLEPSPPQISPSLGPRRSPFLLPCDTPQPLNRYHPPPGVIPHNICATSPETQPATSGNLIDSDHDSAPSPVEMSVGKSSSNSKALVAVPAVNLESLAVIPGNRKSKGSEIAQRRIRRPFSVAEVEALVQAVEKLGTGRWRDVKLRAFDNAKHRTYVDLKDKWKTLVHTARISPQQRRGEPVPQELLDRVLTAHAYWSQQQAKQQLKQQQQDTRLFLC
ncbi:hypothetical protein K2173_015595 [Erythroxylum novogranatense]|uniref:Uncharacterized protein n=1 Tax=Erythroxylum novogranatense TaxID=1862640 RepID=A0AAV8SE04_9ROSI|nr:hypothetical protein K2173_015595 [Erythroxylum novogranatense]